MSANDREADLVQAHTCDLRPRLCFVGPMIGRHPGQLTTQGSILSDLFAAAGYPVRSVSSSLNRWIRLFDIVSTLIRHRHTTDVIVLEIYARRSFVVEDIASRIARLCRVPLIMVLHGGSLPAFAVSFPGWTRRTLGRADAHVAPSAFLARVAHDLGLSARIIPNVLELDRLPYRQRLSISPRLLWMRTFYRHYNPGLAIRVLARLRASWPEASLVMAGKDKGLEQQTRLLAASLGVQASVRFPGFLDSANKKQEGERADIFLNTNDIDNMPVALLEPCARGLPVVSTDAGGIRDLLVDGETGLIVPTGDVDAMSDAVMRLVKDPALAARLSANGRSLAERSAWPQVREMWERLFSEVDRRRVHSVRALAHGRAVS